MASLKEIKGRIASIRNTQKITSAMGMVASAKLLHAEVMTERFLFYKDHLQSIVESLGGLPLTTNQQEGAHATLLIPISSNSGLCGAFNSNIAKATFQHIKELEQQGTQVHLLPVGKRIAHELKKANLDCDCDFNFINLLEKIEKDGTFAEVASLLKHALQLHENGAIDSMEFLYHHFKSMGSQIITTTTLMLDMPQLPTKEDEHYLTEPTPQELLTSLFPRWLNAQTYGILLDSLTSEHAARMLAMQTADDNANDLLKELTLLYNKTRQQAITNELIDIMGGRAGKQ